MNEDTFHIQWHITDFCNLRCRHCYQDNFTPEKDLPFEKLEKIFLNIVEFLEEKENKKLVLDITGGELFLHKDWKILIDYLYNSLCVKELGIITNGFFLNEKTLDYFKKYISLKIKISAEGFDESGYELFRGKGNYKKFLKVCNMLNEEDFEKILMFTLLEENFPQVEKLFDFAEKYQFDKFVIERFIPWGRGRKIKKYMISYENWIKTIEILMKKCNLEKDLLLPAIIPYRGFMVEVKNASFELYGAPCIVGKEGIAVMPDGTVFPCRRFPLKIGNLLKEPLGKIWTDSPVLKMLRDRKFLKGNCNICEIEECFGCRALAYSIKEDFLAEDPLCIM